MDVRVESSGTAKDLEKAIRNLKDIQRRAGLYGNLDDYTIYFTLQKEEETKSE